jgi:uncharacterized LabA/DUF88 family protein
MSQTTTCVLSYPTERLVLFIDGFYLYSAAKSLRLDIDYRALLTTFARIGQLIHAQSYHAVLDTQDDEENPLRPLLDWLAFNGFIVKTKLRRDFTDNTGAFRTKANVSVEIACDMLQAAAYADHLVLFSGENDLIYAVEAVQKLGKRVTVVASTTAQNALVALDLRKQADCFMELEDLRSKIGKTANGKV